MTAGEAGGNSRVGFDQAKHMRGSLVLTVGRGLGLAMGVVIELLLVRALSPGAFGDLSWALATASIATAFLVLGLDSVAPRLFAGFEDQHDDASLLGTLLALILLPITLGAVLVGVAWLVTGTLSADIAPSQQAAELFS